MLYQIYIMLESPRQSVMLPALHLIVNNVQKICELNGIAVFKQDKRVGYLTPEQSKYALFVENQVGSGILPLSMVTPGKPDISLEILTNTSHKSFTYEEGKIMVHIQTSTEVSVAENAGQIDVLDETKVKQVENAAAEIIQGGIKDLLSKVQSEYQADVFGFGEMIYKQDLALWKQLEPSWDQLYPTVEVEVSSTVKVVDTAFIH